MIIRKGTKFLCTEDVNNVFGMPLFKKGETYEVLYVDSESVDVRIVLNHVLYANEYMDYKLDWVLKNFKQI